MQLFKNRKELLLGVILLIGALLGSAAVSYRQARELHDLAGWVTHTHEVQAVLATATGSLASVEKSQRGFIITGDQVFLKNYEAERRACNAALDQAVLLTADNPLQEGRAVRLKKLVGDQLEIVAQNLELRQTEGFEAARNSMAGGEGRAMMSEIQSLAQEMSQEEGQLLIARELKSDEAYQSILLSTLLGLLLALSAVGALLWLLRRHLQAVAKSTATIHEQRELLRAMLISIGDGVIATDRDGCVTLLNDLAQKLTGWREDEARGLPLDKIFTIINEETRQPVDNPAFRALREGRIMGLANHTILISRDGTEWPIDDSAAPVRNRHNEINGVILVFREIRERKRQEAELRQHTQALQEADRRKDEFLATLAHELRNPLSPLSNALQIWPKVENDPAEMEQLRQMMERQVAQMTRLIDDLLDVSRITRGKIELRNQPVDLQTLIKVAVEAVDPLVAASNHQLALDLPQEPLLIAGDVARLTQVFANILHNAAKYTPPGGSIRVAAAKSDGVAVVTVSDNGVGIPAEMLTRVFEMFQQVDQTLERSHGGLGIGLTLVKRLVELHGGQVEAQSEGAGHGSAFVVTLPLLPAGQFQQTLERPPAGPRPVPEGRPRSAPVEGPGRRRRRGFGQNPDTDA